MTAHLISYQFPDFLNTGAATTAEDLTLLTADQEIGTEGIQQDRAAIRTLILHVFRTIYKLFFTIFQFCLAFLKILRFWNYSPNNGSNSFA